MPVTPMFPLGTVLLPGMLLPLHVFEPRYQQLVADCREGDETFGVVLIERGPEVGGGDVRTGVGTLARIVQAQELDGGRWMLVTVGTARVRVDRWLPDDPYPRAEVVPWPDEPGGEGEPGGTGGDWEEVTMLLRRAAALRREVGEPAPPLDLELSNDPVVASYQAVAAAPLGPADRQGMLEASSLGHRLVELRGRLETEIEVLQARLASGG